MYVCSCLGLGWGREGGSEGGGEGGKEGEEEQERKSMPVPKPLRLEQWGGFPGIVLGILIDFHHRAFVPDNQLVSRLLVSTA